MQATYQPGIQRVQALADISRPRYIYNFIHHYW